VKGIRSKYSVCGNSSEAIRLRASSKAFGLSEAHEVANSIIRTSDVSSEIYSASAELAEYRGFHRVCQPIIAQLLYAMRRSL